MYDVGLDFLGFALIGVGFYRVGKELNTYKGYTVAAYVAFAAALPALLNLYDFATVFGLPDLPSAVTMVKGVLISLLSAVLCLGYCGSTSRIAEEGGAKFFSFRAKLTAYVSAFYYAVLAVYGATGAAISGSGASLIVIGRYLLPLFNAWLLFTCFTTITTKARAVKEEKLIKEELEVLERKRAFKKKQDEED